MGAQQSTDNGQTSSGAANVTKTCYYELLDVERHATDDEIKRAYRRKALELHPDRNINDVQAATRKFAEVQSAYEVLSDPQERAWYDSHRDAILGGHDVDGLDEPPTTFRNVRLTTTEEIMNLMRRFNAAVPFDDEPTGFFGIARETFEHLALEEEAAAEGDYKRVPSLPTFGSSDDDYESVVKPFYASWAGFSTVKSFSWKDKYRLSDAPDRRVRRLMEKENKKLRDDAIREFNEAVNFLVGFVRKRDPRYLPNTQTNAERQASLRNAAAAQAARSRAANQERLADFSVPEWARPRSNDGQTEDHFSHTDEESEIEVLECVACNKTFKSENQLEAHERSKKHVKAVQQLRRQMEREGIAFQLNDEPGERSSATKSGNGRDDANENDGTVNRPTETDLPLQTDIPNPQASTPGTPGTPETLEEESPSQAELGSSEMSETDDYAPRSAVEDRLAANEPVSIGAPEDVSTSVQNLSVDAAPPKTKVGKAKAKRDRKAAAAAESQKNNMHSCASCAKTFESRTKLFSHIRESNHAAPTPVTPANKSGSRGKKRSA